MTAVITNLRIRKQKLIEQLAETRDVDERESIVRQLEQINTALDLLGMPQTDPRR